MRPLLKVFATISRIAAPIVSLILYGSWFTSTQAKTTSIAEYVASWDFGAKEDIKRDQWPDGWTRTSSQQFPKFIPIAISRQARSQEELQEIEQIRRMMAQCLLAYRQGKPPWKIIPESVPFEIDNWLERSILNPFLQVSMNGGAAEILSPVIPVDAHSVYFMTASLRSNSEDFYAVAKLRFLDGNRKILFDVASKSVSGETDWVSVSTDNKYQYRDDIRHIQVVLQVLPKSTKAFRGNYGFDAIRIHRTPRINLFVEKPSQLYKEGEQVVVHCSATGMTKEQTELKLMLTDHTGTTVAESTRAFVREDSPTPRYVSNKPNTKPNPSADAYWDGKCEWKLPALEPGYYEITTQLAQGRKGVFQLNEQFVVLPNDGLGKLDSRFGWTMTNLSRTGRGFIETNALIEMLRESRTGRVKVPIWFDSLDLASMREYTERIDRLQTAGVNCVGVIASPPPSVREKFPRMNTDDTGLALEDSILVQNFLEPVMRQMCIRIVDFQVGWDHETDFVANPRLNSSLDAIKRLARRYGQEAQLLSSHSPNLPTPQTRDIDRWQLYSSEPLTAQELAYTLDRGIGMEHGAKTSWVSISPLNASKYSLSVRVQDLVARMLATTKDFNGLGTTAWISDPANQRVGLIDEEGGPREMFLPFRSMAGALAGNRNVGSIPLPALGSNFIIASGDKGSLIAWAVEKQVCQMYLGESVKARDVWGRNVPIETISTEHGKEQRFHVGIWPIIIDGIDLNVARWRMGISVPEKRLDPLLDQMHELKVRFANPLAVPAIGRLQVVAPTVFGDSASVPFEIDPNSEGMISVPVQIKQDANTSNSSIQLEFQMSAGDRQVQFAVTEEVQIGNGDVEFEPHYQFDEQNRLWINIDVINHTGSSVSFDCMLLIPGRPRERVQIAGLAERDSRLIVLNDADQLLGETLWLRCQQIGTKRIQNHRIEVKREEFERHENPDRR